MAETRSTREDASGGIRTIIVGFGVLAVSAGVYGCADAAHEAHIERGEDGVIARSIDVVDNVGDIAVGVGGDVYRAFDEVASD